MSSNVSKVGGGVNLFFFLIFFVNRCNSWNSMLLKMRYGYMTIVFSIVFSFLLGIGIDEKWLHFLCSLQVS